MQSRLVVSVISGVLSFYFLNRIVLVNDLLGIFLFIIIVQNLLPLIICSIAQRRIIFFGMMPVSIFILTAIGYDIYHNRSFIAGLPMAIFLWVTGLIFATFMSLSLKESTSLNNKK